LRESDIDLHGADAFQGLHDSPSFPYEPPRIVRLNAERKADVPGLADLQPLYMPTFYDVTPGLRMPYASQSFEHTPPEIPFTHFDSFMNY